MTFLFKNNNEQGFTLIELLVVLVIIGISISLVAPDLFNALKRTQAKNEIERIYTLTEIALEYSYFSSTRVDLYFNEDEIIFKDKSNDDKELKKITTTYTFFEEQTLSIDGGNWLTDDTIIIRDSLIDDLNEIDLIKDEKEN